MGIIPAKGEVFHAFLCVLCVSVFCLRSNESLSLSIQIVRGRVKCEYNGIFSVIKVLKPFDVLLLAKHTLVDVYPHKHKDIAVQEVRKWKWPRYKDPIIFLTVKYKISSKRPFPSSRQDSTTKC